MEFLNVRTVYLTMLTADILCTLVLVQLWRQSRERFEGTGFWAVNYCFYTSAFFLILLRGIVPDWISIIVANAMIFAGAILGYVGLERFTGKRGPQIHNYVLLCAFVIVHGYFTFVQPDLRIRSINISAALLIISFQCVWLMLAGAAPHMRPLTRCVGLVFAAFCVVNICRIAGLLAATGLEQDYFRLSGSETIIPLLYELLLIALTYCLSLMVNKRLLVRIANEEAKFSTAFHCSPYAIALTSFPDGRILEVNEAFVNATGYTRSEVLGETSLDLHIWRNEESRDAIVAELSKHGSIREMEEQLRTKSGEVRTGLISAGIITINNEKHVLSSIVDITERKRVEEERNRLISELQNAVSQIKTLSGLLPICASCKKIRDDKGYWQQIEHYVREHSNAEFTHSICPACARVLYPEIADKLNLTDEPVNKTVSKADT